MYVLVHVNMNDCVEINIHIIQKMFPRILVLMASNIVVP